MYLLDHILFIKSLNLSQEEMSKIMSANAVIMQFKLNSSNLTSIMCS